MKTIILLLDGLGDRPHKELSGKTPLEMANTPNLNKLCSIGETGMMVPWKQGVPLGTEAAHFILFGYDMEDFPGRGIINALSRDFDLEDNTVYLVTSWSYVEGENSNLYIKERWTRDLSLEEINKLKNALPTKVDDFYFDWQYSIGPHGVLTIKGKNISSSISDSDPFYDNGHVLSIEAFESNHINAYATADALNNYLKQSYNILKNHPINKKRAREGKQLANFILTKWAGEKPNLLTFEEKHGMKGEIIGSSQLFYGIARLLNMDYTHYNDFTEGINLALKSSCDFVHLHTKAPDEAAHTKNPWNKVQVLEEIDAQIKPLVDLVENEDILLIVTGDHCTPSSGSMIHSGETVPIMFVGKNVRPDDIAKFGERSCAKGSIRIHGSDLMQMILNYTERALFYNFKPSGRRLNHIPKTVNKFEIK